MEGHGAGGKAAAEKPDRGGLAFGRRPPDPDRDALDPGAAGPGLGVAKAQAHHMLWSWTFGRFRCPHTPVTIHSVP